MGNYRSPIMRPFFLLPLVLPMLAACAYGPGGGYDPESDSLDQGGQSSQPAPPVTRTRQVRAQLFGDDVRVRVVETSEALAPAPMLAGAAE